MPDDGAGPLLVDSITRLGPEAAGAVVVTGSHGGVYPAALALAAGCRAAIFNDAGIGRDAAGVAGLALLARHGMAAAAVDHASAHIGDAADMHTRGVVSRANEAAGECGVASGMSCAEAARLLAAAPAPAPARADVAEGRSEIQPEGARRRLVLVDSASLVEPRDTGHVVVTGSHGALFGDDPANALKVDAALALFNDAGGGVGTTRLPALDARGVPAATVAADTARIGVAQSTWCDGVISACNAAARAVGATPGMTARALVEIALKR